MHSHNRTLVASLGFADPDKKLSRHDLGCQYMGMPAQTSKLLKLLRPDLSQDLQLVESAWQDFTLRACDSGLVVWLKNDMSIDRVTSHDHRKVPIVGEEAKVDWTQEAHRFATAIASVASGNHVQFAMSGRVVSVDAPEPEAIVSVGTAQYKRTIGFLDVRFRFVFKSPSTCQAWESARMPQECGRQLLERLGDTVDRHDVVAPVVSFQTEGGELYQERVVVEVKTTRVPIGDIVRQMNLYREHDSLSVRHWVVATYYVLSRDDAVALRSGGLVHVLLGKLFNEYVAQREADSTIASNSEEM